MAFLHTKHCLPVNVLSSYSNTDSETQRHTTVKNTLGLTDTTYRKPSMHAYLCTQTLSDSTIYNYRHPRILPSTRTLLCTQHAHYTAPSEGTLQELAGASCVSQSPVGANTATLWPWAHGAPDISFGPQGPWRRRLVRGSTQASLSLSLVLSLHVEGPRCYFFISK